MTSSTYKYRSSLAQRLIPGGYQHGVVMGFLKGLEIGNQEGEQYSVFEVLEARGLAVDAAVRKQILACTDPAQLKRWLRKAVTVESAQELFSSEPAPKPSARRAVKAGRSLKASKPRSKR